MAMQWLRRLFGMEVRRLDPQSLTKYRAAKARYVAVRTFHSNVQHWLQEAHEALRIIQADDEHSRATHPLITGLRPMSLEVWWSDEQYQYPPQTLWSELLILRQQLTEALDHTTPSTQEYHRRMTKALFDDLAVIENALIEVVCNDHHQQSLTGR